VVQQRTVSELGVTETMIPALVRDTLSDIVIGNTPRTPSEEEVRELLVTTL
jgi:alcohol dehydrogenase class IV